MNKILELMEKRAKAWEAAKVFLDSKEGSNLSAEDSATYEKMESEVINLGREIERLERRNTIDMEMQKPTSQPHTNNPENREVDEGEGRASKTYNKAFWNAIKNKNYYDLQNSLSIGVDSDGGYLVPDEFEKTLVEALEEENFMRKVATVIRTESGERKIPVVATRGDAAWLDEEEQYQEDTDTFSQVSIGAYKVGTMLRISEELLNDSAFNMAAYIAKEFGRRIGSKEEEAFITGDGVAKPLGIFKNLGQGSTVIQAATDKLTFDDIMDLYHTLRSPYRKSACWVMNDSVIKMIRKLKDANGNYLWQPSVTAGVPDLILNRPYYTSSFAPVEKKVPLLAFGDLSYYWIADRQGRSFKRLNELYAAQGQVGFLASQRTDGRLVLSEALCGLKLKEA